MGTSIRDLAEQCGGFIKRPESIIINGVVCGVSSGTLDAPITKYVKSITFLPASKTPNQKQLECIRCGNCRRVCPLHLSPDVIYSRMVFPYTKDKDDVYIKSSELCNGCGLCNASCPARLPLSQVIYKIAPKNKQMASWMLKRGAHGMEERMNMKVRKAIVRPFTYLKSSMGTECRRVIALLVLQVLLLFVSKSFMAIVVVFSAIAASVVANLICNKTRFFTNGNYYSYSLSIVQGCIVGMFLPEAYPPVTVFVVTFCTMIIGKYIYKNFYYHFINPSVFTLAVLYIVGAGIFGSPALSLDLLSSRNPSQMLIENGFFPTLSFDTAITDFLNKTVFGLFKFSIPEGYISMLWDTHGRDSCLPF